MLIDMLTNTKPGSLIWDIRNGDILKVSKFDIATSKLQVSVVFSVAPDKTDKEIDSCDFVYLSDLNNIFKSLSPEVRAAVGLLMSDMTGIKLFLQELSKSLSPQGQKNSISPGGIIF